jgi:hypothetical protein
MTRLFILLLFAVWNICFGAIPNYKTDAEWYCKYILELNDDEYFKSETDFGINCNPKNDDSCQTFHGNSTWIGDNEIGFQINKKTNKVVGIYGWQTEYFLKFLSDTKFKQRYVYLSYADDYTGGENYLQATLIGEKPPQNALFYIKLDGCAVVEEHYSEEIYFRLEPFDIKNLRLYESAKRRKGNQ